MLWVCVRGRAVQLPNSPALGTQRPSSDGAIWLEEGVGFRSCSPPASLLQALPEHSLRAQAHSPHWQRDAAAATRDPGKPDNSGVGKIATEG